MTLTDHSPDACIAHAGAPADAPTGGASSTDSSSIGLAFRDWFGLSPVEGAVLAALYVAAGAPLDATQLARRAGSTPGAISVHIVQIRRALEVESIDYLPRAGYPIRHGTHANSAFGLALACDYAVACGDRALQSLVRATALAWFGDDADAPWAWEPSGADFLSPVLMEAALMRRALGDDAFRGWLAAFLPALDADRPMGVLSPARVADRSDPQIVHLDGLNLSRAWCLTTIAGAFATDHPVALRATRAAAAHLAAGRNGLASTDYGGTHWLATFAVLAELDDGRTARG